MIQNKKRILHQNERILNQDNPQVTEFENDILTDIYKQIQQLFKIRFIEKLARPINIDTKDSQAKSFNQQLESIHSKLIKFRVNLIQKLSTEENSKEKSIEEERTNKNAEIKKKIRAIESRYNEIFSQGSFKYYYKIKSAFNLSTHIEIFQIVEWANDCIERLVNTTQGCC